MTKRGIRMVVGAIPGSVKSNAAGAPGRALGRGLRTVRWPLEFLVIVPATVILYALLFSGGEWTSPLDDPVGTLTDIATSPPVAGLGLGIALWGLSGVFGGFI